MVQLVLLAFGLAADSFAVSISIGATATKKYQTAIKTSLVFGVVQGLIPLLGWIIGLTIKDIFMGLNTPVAAGILGYLGIRMVLKSFDKKKHPKRINLTSNTHLLVLALATSVDALVVGFSFAFIDDQVGVQLLLIGVITGVLSFIGVMLGEEYAHRHLRRISVAFGGIVLILLALKILFEHIF